MLKVIAFDLDDTLYDERSYVQSGMRAVAHFLAPRVRLSEQALLRALLTELEQNGRGRTFDAVLERHGQHSKGLVRKCLSVYRMHRPGALRLRGSRRVLERLRRDYSLYVVTDGNKLVQQAKVEALGLTRYVKKALCTHAYGRSHAKPSAYCFELIRQWEKVRPDEVLYVGDNPRKDFVGLRPLGYRTVRLSRGPYKDTHFGPMHEAEFVIRRLEELPALARSLSTS